MAHHNLKTDPAVFQAVFDGRKTYEIRLNDRNFRVGDTMTLQETQFDGEQMKPHPDPYGSELEPISMLPAKPLIFTGREVGPLTITHVLKGYGLKPGWVILSFPSKEASFDATRLRRLAKLVGLENALPGSDTTVVGCAFTVLGMIARKVEEMKAEILARTAQFRLCAVHGGNTIDPPPKYCPDCIEAQVAGLQADLRNAWQSLAQHQAAAALAAAINPMGSVENAKARDAAKALLL